MCHECVSVAPNIWRGGGGLQPQKPPPLLPLDPALSVRGKMPGVEMASPLQLTGPNLKGSWVCRGNLMYHVKFQYILCVLVV